MLIHHENSHFAGLEINEQILAMGGVFWTVLCLFFTFTFYLPNKEIGTAVECRVPNEVVLFFLKDKYFKGSFKFTYV